VNKKNKSAVLVTGTLGYDYIMNYAGLFSDRIMPEKIHQISLSFLVDKLNKNFGGTAGNIAYTLNLLGTKPLVVSAAGNDFAPYRTFWKKYRLSTQGIVIHKDIITGSYFVVTDTRNNQIGSFYTGATKYAESLSIKPFVDQAQFVILAPTEPQAMYKYAQECVAAKIPYLFDPAFQISDFKRQQLTYMISHAQILIGNDYEIALIEKKLGLSHIQLCRLVPIAITTLAEKGSYIDTEYGQKRIDIPPARPKNTSDPTGAGDCYRAGFLAGYLRHLDLETCGKIASVATVYTVEKYGTQTHEFTKAEFTNRYKENFGETVSL